MQSGATECSAVREQVLKLYNHRCAICGRRTRIIHEIVPRSVLPNDWCRVDNMIALCAEHHEQVHNRGTKASEAWLRKHQRQLP